MEIIDNRNIIVDENIKTGDVLEVIDPEDHRHEYWIVGCHGDIDEEKAGYSLINLETGVALLATDLDSALKYYCLGCDIRVVDTELHIVE
ncbi:hypothetical protein [Ligilactobacillus salivarius]|jgi:hypothetical protein|uniref:hypothetical protein n=1 Tax=Ligilactobacillus salivarius TaxID=1624 RepID=UPI00136C1235|nr:hypothetical protein [Ligilactobacillus salivarius]MYV10600.1 hypothetical protein [Ligilactobacillus salivarius]